MKNFLAFIKFPNNFSTGNDPVFLKVSAVSVGDGGSKAEWQGGDLAKLPTLSVSVNAVPDGVELNVPEGLVVPGTEEMPIAMDIRGRLKDEAESISEIKFTLTASSADVPGAMIVSRKALQDYAVSRIRKAGVGLMRLRLLLFKGLETTKNYATADGTAQYNPNSNGSVYYVSKEAFDPTVNTDVDPLIVPENGQFSLSELLFIPPLNVAGELDVGLSIKTKQGSTEQAEATTTAFKLDIAAVADSPELKAPDGSEINLSQNIPNARPGR